MPFKSQTSKIVFSGALPGTERWSASMCIDHATALDSVELGNVLDEVITDFGAGGGFFAELAAINPATVTLDTVTAYYYSGGTKAALQAERTGNYLPTHTNAVTLPNQVCAVASLRTGLPGRSQRGRMYIPCLSVAMGANGLATTTGLNLLADGLAQSMGTFNASGRGKIVVASATTGFNNPVTEIIMDSVLDTQRRRRSSVVGTTHTSAVAA